MLTYKNYTLNKNKEQEELMYARMKELKEINKEYIRRITKMKDEVESNGLVYEISQELKAKSRIQFSAFFYFSFYTFGSSLVSNHFGHSLPVRLCFLSFLFIPNIIYYNKKFLANNSKIQEILLTHTLSKFYAKDKELKNFLTDYIDYYNKKH